MSEFLLIHGMEIPVSAGGSPDVDYQERGGEVQPAFAGNLLSSVKGLARVWRVQTPALSESDAWYYEAVLRSAYSVPCDGQLTGGPVLAMVRGLRMRPVPRSSGIMWTVEFELHESVTRRPDGNLPRHPGFEEGGDYWGVPLSTSWLGPGAGAEVAITDGGSASKAVTILPRTPIADLSLTVGALVSAACDAISDAGGRALLVIRWEDAAQASIRFDQTAPYTGNTWSRRAVEAKQVPADAVYVMVLCHGYDTGTVRFRNATIGPGSTAPPYHSAAVMHDPARAHEGSRYLEVAGTPGAQSLVYASDDRGRFIEWPVRAGDQCAFGGWVRRVTGDATVRPWLGWYRDGALLSIVSLASGTDTWERRDGLGSPPAGATHLRFACQISSTGTVPTTARFDDVYLRIRRGG